MDSKLKALKVVDLKAILANANLSCPTKSTKPDIIARIIASDEAINSYYQLYDPQKLVKSQPPILPSPPPPSPPNPIPSSQPTIPSPPSEAEKRLQRAARFGIPVVDSSTKQTPPPKIIPDDLEKLKARAARFGMAATGPAILEHVDPEEAERRRKRAERFGLPTTV